MTYSSVDHAASTDTPLLPNRDAGTTRPSRNSRWALGLGVGALLAGGAVVGSYALLSARGRASSSLAPTLGMEEDESAANWSFDEHEEEAQNPLHRSMFSKKSRADPDDALKSFPGMTPQHTEEAMQAEIERWIRDNHVPHVAAQILKEPAPEDDSRGVDISKRDESLNQFEASLGGDSRYKDSCNIPEAPLPANCVVQKLAHQETCRYTTMAKNKLNLPTCDGVDTPVGGPKANDEGERWIFSTTIDVPYTATCSRSIGYSCQTGTKKNCRKVFKRKYCHNSPVFGTCHRHQHYPCAKTRKESVGHDFKKTVLTCERMKLMVGKDKCVTCIPGFTTDADGKCVSQLDAIADQAKEKAMGICDAIPVAIDKASDVIMKAIFPADAGALTDILADAFASATGGGASSSASMGSAQQSQADKSRTKGGQKSKLDGLRRDAFRAHQRRVAKESTRTLHKDTSMDLFDDPSNHRILRDAIRSALRGEDVPEHVQNVEFMGRRSTGEAKLGKNRDCSVVPVDILNPDDFEELSSVVYDMPWSKKLATAAFAPDNFKLKLPVITFKTCTSSEPMTFPTSIGADILKAFSDFFEPLILGGFDALKKIDCKKILKVITEVKEKMQKVLDEVLDELKKLKKKIPGGRKLLEMAGERLLLETDDETHRAAIRMMMNGDSLTGSIQEMHASLWEEMLFARALELRTLFDLPKSHEWTDDHLSQPANFHKQIALLGGSDGHVALLGGNSFGDRLKKLGNDLGKALEGIKNIGMGWTITQEISLAMGFSAQSDEAANFKNGEIFDSLDIADDIATSMSASAETPIFAGLSASSILDVNMAMPFFLLTDGKIDFDMTAGVKTSVSFGVRDTKPYFDFKPPTPFFDTGAKVSASLAFQQGLQYILNEFSIGICAGGTCTGPVLGFQQDMYVGVDTFAVASLMDADEATCFRGPTTLSTTFVDWDYPEETKKECAIVPVGGSFGMGAYVKVPAPQLSLVVNSWVGNFVETHQDFQMQNAVGSDDMLMTEVYHTCVQGGKGEQLEPCPTETCIVLPGAGHA